MSVFYSEHEPTKKICECCCQKITCPRIPSTKASSVWNTRNDSSNVSSLLAPDSHVIEDKSNHSTATRTILSKSRQQRRCIRSAPLTSKKSEEITHCEDCYCRESPIIPTFSSKLRSIQENTIKLTNIRRSIPTIGHQCRSYGVKRIPRHPDEVKILEDKSVGVGSKNKLRYTHTRNDYETKLDDLRGIDEPGDRWRIDEAISKLNEVGERSRIDGTGEKWRANEANLSIADKPRQSSETLEVAQDAQRNINLSDTFLTYKDFKDLARFRKDNYFDCHSSVHSSASASIPEHKCIHKFVINDRFLPQPLNSDSFGISRCDVCNKPMELYKSEKPRVESKQKSVNKVKQVYEYNLTPPRLNIGRGNETVQIKVPEKLGNECLLEQSPNFKITRKVPGNSYALRYQRGRI